MPLNGAIFYTIPTDSGKAAAIGRNGGGLAFPHQVYLQAVEEPETRAGAFRFTIRPTVSTAFTAWMATNSLARLDYISWIGHAGPAYLSAAQARGFGTKRIQDMSLIPEAEPADRLKKAPYRVRLRRLEQRLATIPDLNTIAQRAIDHTIRAYISMQSVADLIAIGKPRIIHMNACNFGKAGTGSPNLPWRSQSGPQTLGGYIAAKIKDKYPYVAVMTYSTTDTGVQSSFVPGNSAADQGRVLIKDNTVADVDATAAARALTEHAENIVRLDTAASAMTAAAAPPPDAVLRLIGSFLE